MRAANGESQASARAALEELCRSYWYPLYAYARRRGHDGASAEDLTQGFFTQLLARDDLAKADPTRGRFRSFLLTAFQNFLLNEQVRQEALKRGGRHRVLSIDSAEAAARYELEAAGGESPERLFARRWALDLLARVRRQLRDEYVSAGKGELYQRLEGVLAGQLETAPLATIAAELGLSESAVKVASFRLRRRFGERLREEIAHTVSSPAEIDEEIRDLFEALRT